MRLASTSPDPSGAVATSTDTELSFIFPEEDGGVYVSCTYPISWTSPATINSLETALIDAGTKEAAGPVASGLAKEIVIEKDERNLDWKVGSVWPGSYYIKISKINGADAEIRSKTFAVNKMAENISKSEKENVCKESGGSI